MHLLDWYFASQQKGQRDKGLYPFEVWGAFSGHHVAARIVAVVSNFLIVCIYIYWIIIRCHRVQIDGKLKVAGSSPAGIIPTPRSHRSIG